MYDILCRRVKCHALIIPGSDMHGSEHPIAPLMLRHYVSGFFGSAGTFVACNNGAAALWTDGRYEIAAGRCGTERGWDARISTEHSWAEMMEWIRTQIPPAFSRDVVRVGLCPLQASDAMYRLVQTQALSNGMVLQEVSYPALRDAARQCMHAVASARNRRLKKQAKKDSAPRPAKILPARIPAALAPSADHEPAAHKQSRAALWHVQDRGLPYDKKRLDELSAFLQLHNADCFISSDLHEIAFFTGLRAAALPHTMLFPAVLVWFSESAAAPLRLMMALPKDLHADARDACRHMGLSEAQCIIMPYEEFLTSRPFFRACITRAVSRARAASQRADSLTAAGRESILALYDPARTAALITREIAQDPRIALKAVASFAQDIKDIRSEAELALIRESCRQDCAAILEGLAEVCEKFAAGGSASEGVTEMHVAQAVRRARETLAGFEDESFDTISAAGENGALPHYKPEPHGGANVAANAPYLLDCGAHYACAEYAGTTDITRTFLFSELLPGDKQAAQKSAHAEAAPALAAYRRDYTAVLKSHIALALHRFSSSRAEAQAEGKALDAVARAALYACEKRTYNHGTGHGVGFCTDVHEGARSISSRGPLAQKPFVPHVVVTNEPGFYTAGAWGVRLENMLCVRKDVDAIDGRDLYFETLTFFPFQQSLIEERMLSAGEKKWLADYQRECEMRLLPLLSDKARALLHALMRANAQAGGAQKAKKPKAAHAETAAQTAQKKLLQKPLKKPAQKPTKKNQATKTATKKATAKSLPKKLNEKSPKKIQEKTPQKPQAKTQLKTPKKTQPKNQKNNQPKTTPIKNPVKKPAAPKKPAKNITKSTAKNKPAKNPTTNKKAALARGLKKSSKK